MPTSSALREFATCPAAFLPPGQGVREIDDARVLLRVSPAEAVLTRLRFAPGEAAEVLTEVRSKAPRRKLVLTTHRADLAEAFRGLGFRDPAPPIGPTCTALALDHAPPEGQVEVRLIETFEDFRTGLEIEDAVFGYSRRATDVEAVYERRRGRPGGEWLAFLDGRAVAYAGAVAGRHGLYLASGATLPEFRGRGAYRSLVRARWDRAVALGTPALVVHAQETSRPVLEHLGFEHVCTIHELELDPATC